MNTRLPQQIDFQKNPIGKTFQALFTDSAIVGEAAAYGMGLVMCGSNSESDVKELLSYAHDTQHEKIIRACVRRRKIPYDAPHTGKFLWLFSRVSEIFLMPF